MNEAMLKEWTKTDIAVIDALTSIEHLVREFELESAEEVLSVMATFKKSHEDNIKNSEYEFEAKLDNLTGGE